MAMYNKDQAHRLNVSMSNHRPYEAQQKLKDVPEYVYVSTQFVPITDPVTNTVQYMETTTGPACRLYNPATQETEYKPWEKWKK